MRQRRRTGPEQIQAENKVPTYPGSFREQPGLSDRIRVRRSRAGRRRDATLIAAPDALHRSIVALNGNGPASAAVTHLALAILAIARPIVVTVMRLADPHADAGDLNGDLSH